MLSRFLPIRCTPLHPNGGNVEIVITTRAAESQLVRGHMLSHDVHYRTQRYTRMKGMWKLLSLHAALEVNLSEGTCSLMMYIAARGATPE